MRLPEPVLRLFIKSYISWYGVDMGDVLMPSTGFNCFGEFFTRSLRPEARPVSRDPGAVVSPCDAAILEYGRIDADTMNLVVIKGTRYSIRDLIGDNSVAAGLAGGGYCMFYLHPRDYHRVHVPTDGSLRAVRHMPGARYPMAPWASRFSNGALGKNERMAFDIERIEDGRRYVVLMVAAFGVGGIESSYMPEYAGGRRTGLADVMSRGDEIGLFRIGSTVVLFWPKGAFEIDSRVKVDEHVLVGQEIGRLDSADLKKS
jgi:phosphatidylserine decarboxylase